VIPALNNIFNGDDMFYLGANGERIMRPCGLTDTPGGASPAGMAAAMLGLCWALRPIATWKRLASAGLAFVGVAVIYFTHVRSVLVMLLICLAVLTGLLAYQGKTRSALLLVGGGAGMVVGALFWVARTAGARVFERFAPLLSSDPTSFYYKSRGSFIEEAFGRTIWENPLGHGLGWWGMINGTFADPSRPSNVWVEVMIPAWIIDGGAPLLIGYFGAIVVAVLDSLRVAMTSRDPDVSFWAAVVVALNLSIVANCFSFATFVTGFGLQFWLLAAAVHAADAQVRAAERRPAPGRPGPRPRGAPAT
jgi:hypothetical protein